MNTRTRLKELIQGKCVLHGDFVLASGQRAKVYFDGKRATLDPEGVHLIATLILETADRLAAALMPLASLHLLRARNAGDMPIDPVARFHLGNGARLERLNWLADPSENGLRTSHGIMVNYLYKLEDIEKNHEAFANAGVVTASGPVNRLARTLPAVEEIAAA